MELFEFAIKGTVRALEELGLHEQPQLHGDIDDDRKNQFVRHFVGQAGPVKLDVIAIADRSRQMHGVLVDSVSNAGCHWQHFVQKGQGDALHLLTCLQP